MGTRIAAAALAATTVVATAAVASTAVATTAGPARTAGAARTATVRVAHTSAGTLLVAGNGFTLYEFTRDRRNSDRCVKISGCTSVWPPLTVSGRPRAGSGARASLLGTISIGHGRRQVTYAGHPLYRYSADGGPTATDYVGAVQFGGTWYGVSPSGRAVR